MADVQIKLADESHVDEISKFICEHFNGYEPIQLFHYRPDIEMDPPPEEVIRESIAAQTLLLAYLDDKVVGVLIAVEITSEVGEKELKFAETFGLKGADVFGFLAYIERKSNVCERLNIDRSLHIHVVSVHLDHLRKGIARKLFESCFELGRRKNFPALSVDATNFFTAKIAENFQMTCVSTVSYDEYNKHVGKELFRPRHPHNEIKTFAKRYSAN